MNEGVVARMILLMFEHRQTDHIIPGIISGFGGSFKDYCLEACLVVPSDTQVLAGRKLAVKNGWLRYGKRGADKGWHITDAGKQVIGFQEALG